MIVYKMVGQRELSDWTCLLCGQKHSDDLEFRRHLEQDHDIKPIVFTYTTATAVVVEVKQ